MPKGIFEKKKKYIKEIYLMENKRDWRKEYQVYNIVFDPDNFETEYEFCNCVEKVLEIVDEVNKARIAAKK